eukprot:tig00000227_g19862.t1
MGERGDGDEAPEEAPPPPPPSAIDENLSQRPSEPRLEPLDIDHVESEEEEGEKEEAPAAIPAAAHRPFEPHKTGSRGAVSLADPTYANDHKLLREYMDRKHAFFRPWNAMSQGSLNGQRCRDQLPLRWQHAGDVDEYNVDVLTLQDQHMGELCSTMLKRVAPPRAA